jgi:hypothetical protein
VENPCLTRYADVARGLVTDNFEADLPRTGACEDWLSECDTLVMTNTFCLFDLRCAEWCSMLAGRRDFPSIVCRTVDGCSQ